MSFSYIVCDTSAEAHHNRGTDSKAPAFLLVSKGTHHNRRQHPRQAGSEEERRSALPRGNTPGRRPFPAVLAPGVAMSTRKRRGRGSGGTSRADRAPPTRARPAARPPEERQTSKPRRNIASRGNHRHSHDETPQQRKITSHFPLATTEASRGRSSTGVKRRRRRGARLIPFSRRSKSPADDTAPLHLRRQNE